MTAPRRTRLRNDEPHARLRPDSLGRASVPVRGRRRWVWVAAAAAVAMVALLVGIRTTSGSASGGGSASQAPSGTGESSTPATDRAPTASTASTSSGTVAEADTALAAVDELTVKGRAPLTGYERSAYGDGWSDVDGCSTREIILRRDLYDVTVGGGSTCAVLAGTLHDPYTGVTEPLSATTLRTAQIDHVVALGDSWQKGAQQWNEATRVEFANDPLNLLATTGPVNESKGAGDAATWLPPNKSFRCEYVARQVSVKIRYSLWVTAAEKQAMTRVLSGCPGQKLITEQGARQPHDPDPATIQPRTASSDPTSSAQTRPGQQTDPRYPTCAAANRAGLGPYRRGIDPEYAWYRDADGDGVVCER